MTSEGCVLKFLLGVCCAKNKYLPQQLFLMNSEMLQAIIIVLNQNQFFFLFPKMFAEILFVVQLSATFCVNMSLRDTDKQRNPLDLTTGAALSWFMTARRRQLFPHKHKAASPSYPAEFQSEDGSFYPHGVNVMHGNRATKQLKQHHSENI